MLSAIHVFDCKVDFFVVAIRTVRPVVGFVVPAQEEIVAVVVVVLVDCVVRILCSSLFGREETRIGSYLTDVIVIV